MRRIPLSSWRCAARALLALLLGWVALRQVAAPLTGNGMEAATIPQAPPRLRIRTLVIVAAGLLLLAGLGTGAWLARAQQEQEAVAKALTGGDPARAPALLLRYGCGGCHTIPGVPGADGRVAGPLSGMRERVYIGGVTRNTPGNLIGWIVDPRAFSPRTAMPATGISEAEARDVAAYLYAN